MPRPFGARTLSLVLVAAAMVLSLAPRARAQSFNFDANVIAPAGTWSGPPASTYIGVLEQSGVWNTGNVPGGTVTGILDVFGNTTGISVAVNATAINVVATPGITPDGVRLFGDAFTRASPITVTVTGLSPGIYSIATVAIDSGANGDQTVTVSPSLTAPDTVFGPIQNTPTSGVTHALHVSNTTGSLTITIARVGGGTAYFQGLQVRKIGVQQTRLFVNDNAATTTGDGSSWANALVRLEDALLAANLQLGVDEIWVAGGTYGLAAAGPTSNRFRSFSILNGTRVYGGFAGTETSLTQRVLGPNESILSGEIGNPLLTSDNVYHVVSASGTSNPFVLDGFTITRGNANGMPSTTSTGGGLFVEGSTGLVRNCTFRENQGTDGAGAYVAPFGGTFRFADCVFIDNNAENDGGGLAVSFGTTGGSVYVVNSRFLSNSAVDGGGASVSGNVPVAFVNCEFVSNVAATGGAIAFLPGTAIASRVSNCTIIRNSAARFGGIDNNGRLLAVENSILYFNTDTDIFTSNLDANLRTNVPAVVDFNCIQSYSPALLPGTGNIGTNPSFVDADGPDNISGTIDDNTRAASGSPVVDAGDASRLLSDLADLDADSVTAAESVPLDLARVLRRIDLPAAPDTGPGAAPVLDMGAYEATCSTDFDGNGVRQPADIFAFLAAYFANDPRADFDGNGVRQPADIFAFLSAYFAGC